MRFDDVRDISYHENEKNTEDDIKSAKLYIKWNVEEKIKQDAARACRSLQEYIESLIP